MVCWTLGSFSLAQEVRNIFPSSLMSPSLSSKSTMLMNFDILELSLLLVD